MTKYHPFTGNSILVRKFSGWMKIDHKSLVMILSRPAHLHPLDFPYSRCHYCIWKLNTGICIRHIPEQSLMLSNTCIVFLSAVWNHPHMFQLPQGTKSISCSLLKISLWWPANPEKTWLSRISWHQQQAHTGFTTKWGWGKTIICAVNWIIILNVL